MNNNTIHLSSKVTIEIEVDIERLYNNISCFKQTTSDGVTKRVIEGYYEGNNENLLAYGEVRDISGIKKLYMFPKRFLEVHRGHHMGYNAWGEFVENSLIKAPMSYIESHPNWRDEVVVVDLCMSNYSAKLLDGSLIPQAMICDLSLIAGVDSQRYNIRGFVDSIKDNPSVLFLCSPSIKLVESDDGSELVESTAFKFMPTDENFNEMNILEDDLSWEKTRKIIDYLGIENFKL